MAAACDESQWQLKDRLAAVCCNDGRQTRSSRPRLAGDVAGGAQVILETAAGRTRPARGAGPAVRGGLVGVGAQEVAYRQMPPLMVRAGLRDVDVECAGPGGRLAEEGVAHHTVGVGIGGVP